MNHSRYEFASEHDRLLVSLAGRMKWVGGLLILSSGVGIVMSILQMQRFPEPLRNAMRFGIAGSLLGCVYYVVIATYTFKAASSLRTVVETQGHDIRHLMDALRSLRTLYGIQYWLIMIALLFVAAMVLMMCAGFMFFAPSQQLRA